MYNIIRCCADDPYKNKNIKKTPSAPFVTFVGTFRLPRIYTCVCTHNAIIMHDLVTPVGIKKKYINIFIIIIIIIQLCLGLTMLSTVPTISVLHSYHEPIKKIKIFKNLAANMALRGG